MVAFEFELVDAVRDWLAVRLAIGDRALATAATYSNAVDNVAFK